MVDSPTVAKPERTDAQEQGQKAGETAQKEVGQAQKTYGGIIILSDIVIVRGLSPSSSTSSASAAAPRGGRGSSKGGLALVWALGPVCGGEGAETHWQRSNGEERVGRRSGMPGTVRPLGVMVWTAIHLWGYNDRVSRRFHNC